MSGKRRKQHRLIPRLQFAHQILRAVQRNDGLTRPGTPRHLHRPIIIGSSQKTLGGMQVKPKHIDILLQLLQYTIIFAQHIKPGLNPRLFDEGFGFFSYLILNLSQQHRNIKRLFISQ